MTLESNKFKSTPAFPGRLLCLVVGNAARPLAVALGEKSIITMHASLFTSFPSPLGDPASETVSCP